MTLHTTDYHLEDRARRTLEILAARRAVLWRCEHCEVTMPYDTAIYHWCMARKRAEGRETWPKLLVIVFGAGCLLCGAIALVLLRMGGCL